MGGNVRRTRPRRGKHFIIGTCTVVLILALHSDRAFTSTVSIAPGQSCTSAECHGQFGKEPHVHAAMEGGECSVCHVQQGKEHAFKFAAEGDELCYSCHERFGQKKNLHPALEAGCLACHNPHQSKTQHLLQADSVSATCFSCHDGKMIEQKYSHGPASAGECTLCHNPHESAHPKLLNEEPPKLCFGCHSEVQDALSKDKNVHEAVTEGCTTCHNPHGDQNKFILRGEVPKLCYECHADIETMATTATVKHGPVEEDNRCLNCHQPHTSNYGKLLKTAPGELCYECHDKVIETPTGPIKNMKKWVEEHEYRHGPVIDNDCVSCHEPHGSKYLRILKEQYPSGFYSPFTEETYELCFTCHEAKAFIYERTTKATDFRDGSLSLHYLHVNKPYKGRVCTACHEVHASDDPKHIKETTLFGKWEMPIRFKKTDTGGSCYPGCHKYQAYDRENPVMQK